MKTSNCNMAMMQLLRHHLSNSRFLCSHRHMCCFMFASCSYLLCMLCFGVSVILACVFGFVVCFLFVLKERRKKMIREESYLLGLETVEQSGG